MGLDDYVAAFARRASSLGPAAELVQAPGLVAFGTADGHVGGRVLVLDDRSLPELTDFLAQVRVDLVSVGDEATRSRAALETAGFAGLERAAAMVRRDLDGLPDLPLPDDLTISQVQRTPEEPPGVPFDRAIAALLRFDPESGVVPEAAIRAFLLSLPHATLLAAVDPSGDVRATSASGVFDEDGVVVMVSTDPALRGRGIGSAMTAAALRAARVNGAVRACLDASAVGEPIYQRLGFSTVARLSRLSRVVR